MSTPTKTPKASNAKPGGSSKRGFWIPDAIYERVQRYVGQHRNEPDDMSINKFVREALLLKLDQVEKRPRAAVR